MSGCNEHRGTLCVRVGPMYASKSLWLNSELTQFADKGFSVLKIIHSSDVRDDVASNCKFGSTHNSSYKTLTPKITCIRESSLKEINVSTYDVIGIDESQFFEDLCEVVEKWVEIEGKHVRVVGLCGDFQKKKFGKTNELVPLCDEFIKLKASCKFCLEDLEANGFKGNLLSIEGAFTKRLGNSKEQVLVGGSSMYVPVCRFHSYYDNVLE